MKVDVGDVITIKYMKFDGSIETGIFLVFYHESYDRNDSGTFCACKVSSKPSGFQVAISKYYEPYLDHDSYINCTSIQKFTEDQVTGILGQLSKHYLNLTYTQLSNFAKSVDRQMHIKIGRTYLES